MSATSVPDDSPLGTPIQPLHNPSQAAQVVVPQAPVGGGASNAAPGLGAKALLAKKMAKGRNPSDTVSPTDHMMTPCTRKLTAAKKKQFDKRGPKPLQLFAQRDQVNLNNGDEADPKTSNESEEKDINDDNPF